MCHRLDSVSIRLFVVSPLFFDFDSSCCTVVDLQLGGFAVDVMGKVPSVPSDTDTADFQRE